MLIQETTIAVVIKVSELFLYIRLSKIDDLDKMHRCTKTFLLFLNAPHITIVKL